MIMSVPGIGRTGLDRIGIIGSDWIESVPIRSNTVTILPPSDTIRSNRVRILPPSERIQYSFYFTPSRSDPIRFFISSCRSLVRTHKQFFYMMKNNMFGNFWKKCVGGIFPRVLSWKLILFFILYRVCKDRYNILTDIPLSKKPENCNFSSFFLVPIFFSVFGWFFYRKLRISTAVHESGF